MPFSITATRVFCAAHAIRLPDGTTEPLHGHNWEVKVTASRSDGKLDPTGFVLDFHDLEKQLDAVLSPLNNTNLSAHPHLADLNATAENVAYHIARSLKLPPNTKLLSVSITEAPGCLATYSPE